MKLIKKQWLEDAIFYSLSIAAIVGLMWAMMQCLAIVSDISFRKDAIDHAQLKRQVDIVNLRHLREPMNAMEINALMDAPKVRSIKEGTR